MAVVNPLSYISAGLTILIDAIKVNVTGATPTTREVCAIGDDSDYTGTPYVARINKNTYSLYVDPTAGGTVLTHALASSPVAAAATPAAVKSAPGLLFSIVVVTPGTAELTITDGVGGNVIAIVPPGQPIGDVPLYGTTSGRPFLTSLYVNSGTSTPGVTVIYA